MMTRQEMKYRAKKMLGGNIFSSAWMTGVVVTLLHGVVFSFANSIFPGVGGILIGGPLSFGMYMIFLNFVRTGTPMKIEDLFRGFSDDFVQNLLIRLMTSIFCALWSLLFVIPGIVKALAYSMAFYVKRDHPEYDWRMCLSESERLMEGHKMDLFILNLSFIGWAFLGVCAFGVGILWVQTYIKASEAIFYDQLVSNDVYHNNYYDIH